jgi:hypothetical protein
MARLDSNDDAYKILCDLDSLVEDKYTSYNSSPVDYSSQSFLTTSDSYRYDIPQLSHMSPFNSPTSQHSNGHSRSHSYHPGGYSQPFFQPPPPLLRSTTDPLLSIITSSAEAAFYNGMDSSFISKKRGGLVKN